MNMRCIYVCMCVSLAMFFAPFHIVVDQMEFRIFKVRNPATQALHDITSCWPDLTFPGDLQRSVSRACDALRRLRHQRLRKVHSLPHRDRAPGSIIAADFVTSHAYIHTYIHDFWFQWRLFWLSQDIYKYLKHVFTYLYTTYIHTYIHTHIHIPYKL